jgi:hypothetical protein
MSDRIPLREICHARAGDKGDTANIGLVVYHQEHYDWVARHVTTDAVREYFGDTMTGEVERYALPEIGAFNFLLHNALGGGVTRALKVDGHGKGLSAVLLDMEIPVPPPIDSDATPDPSTATVAPIAAKTVRLGGGSAYEADRLDAAAGLAKSGAVDYLVFDCLSEKTLIECSLRQGRGLPACDVFLKTKLRHVLPDAHANGTKVIANAGGLDVDGAAREVLDLCRELDLSGVKVGWVRGGDVRDHVLREDPVVTQTGRPVSALEEDIVCAHAYGGAEPIVEALGRGADVVLSSRAGDAAQFLAPLLYTFGWAPDNWELVGKGLGIGHLMECGGHLSGGYFADPGYKEVPRLEDIGFPIAEVDADGEAVITKLPGTGGLVDERVCKEQLLYEIGDPAEYIHGDGLVDFTETRLIQEGPDRVRLTGIRGGPRPDTVKVVLGVREGFVGMARVMYGGTGAYDRARYAASIVATRLQTYHDIDPARVRFDYVGVNALFPWPVDTSAVKEVELRVAGAFPTRAEAEAMVYEVGTLPCNGPTAASWGRPLDQGGVEEVVGFYSTLIPHDVVNYEVCVATS